MGAAEDVTTLANVTLSGLFDIVKPDIGAVLVLADPSKEPTVRNLKVAAFKAPEDLPYNRVSDRLSTVALRERDGILAMDFSRTDDGEEEFTTLASMNARSVICVPIRDGEAILGLIHLYSLKTEQSLDPDALEFTLAVGEHAGATLRKLLSKTELVSNLKQARRENESLKELLRIESDLIGQSAAMQQLRNEISRFAMSDQTTLICGESGVGKELVARAIHSNSIRKDAPFVAVNCAALSESLLESELFGHEKGSFTGATERKIGKFEQAHKGTIFLDEIGEMSPTMQAKFLRVLEGQPFERVGGQTSVEVNVRVVAATNRNLPEAVREGDFRRDLFFRLNVLTITVPPLRDRRDDIEALAQHFLHVSSNRQARSAKEFEQDAIDALKKYDWPGNVRELRSVVERAFSFSQAQVIKLDDIQFSHLDVGTPLAVESYAPISLAEMEKRHIEATLHFTKWVKREAARILDIERSTLDRKLQGYDIKRPEEG
jgi:Nif-specific regulatory protein